MVDIDVITVHHNDTNRREASGLLNRLSQFEPKRFTFTSWSNEFDNIGFGPACNRAFFELEDHAPVVGFLNPDVNVMRPFFNEVIEALVPDDVVIVGCRFNKPDRELKEWGVKDWVCGATFFVKSDWFAEVGGFDEEYIWAWEETDLIRLAESQGLRCKSINLPIRHSSPVLNSPEDKLFKDKWFEVGRKHFKEKWNA